MEAQTWMTGLFPDGTSPFSRGGALVYRGNGLGGWSELCVTPATGVVKVPDDTPLDVACLIGCAVQTGVGAVLNTAAVEPGSSVLVMGLGGIGQSIVQGARIAGGRLDPGDGRALVGEQHGGDRTGDARREVEHAQPIECSRHDQPPVGSGACTVPR